jgi:serine/threonine protein phosphatase PrpC
MQGYNRKSGPERPMQDGAIIINNFCGVRNQILLCLFDGHGVAGAEIVDFLKNALPQNI